MADFFLAFKLECDYYDFGGDFNVVLNPETDHTGDSKCLKRQACVDTHGLRDIMCHVPGSIPFFAINALGTS